MTAMQFGKREADSLPGVVLWDGFCRIGSLIILPKRNARKGGAEISPATVL